MCIDENRLFEPFINRFLTLSCRGLAMLNPYDRYGFLIHSHLEFSVNA